MKRTKELRSVGFAPKIEGGFFTTVIARVNEYFETRKLSPYANREMWIKTAVMLLLYFVPYIFMVTGFAAGNTFLFFTLWFVMGWGMIGIGTSVMHDAQHGTYSKNNKVNKLIGSILEIIGGYSVTWRIQHNVLHHTYTNIAGLDEDIDSIKLLRFSPRQPRNWYHRYQYVYAWFFYTIMTLYWMTVKDYRQVIRYKQHDLLIKQRVTLGQAIFRITLYKLFYYSYIMVLPILFSGMPWYYVLFGFLTMHFTAGLFLSCVFQPSHIMETSGFSAPISSEGVNKMEDSWAVHEVANTTNFSPHSRILSWFIGGLNYQIEHHLFTGICHVHFPKIAPIVKSTASEFFLPYHEQPTFLKALSEHVKMLRILGRI
ncbi:MAG TPA: acyl-CoA desaturase [Ohtaekwangia sp.]